MGAIHAAGTGAAKHRFASQLEPLAEPLARAITIEDDASGDVIISEDLDRDKATWASHLAALRVWDF